MIAKLKRREFITLLGGAAVAWPLAVRAQQPTMPVLGFLRSTSAAGSEQLIAAFRQGLKEAGFVEGQDVAIDFRWGDDQPDRLPGLAADLVRRQAAVIVANVSATRAAMAATTAIPIVFVSGGDPVRRGLVGSLNRPGGNVTGVVFTSSDLTAKQLPRRRAWLRIFVVRCGLPCDPPVGGHFHATATIPHYCVVCD